MESRVPAINIFSVTRIFLKSMEHSLQQFLLFVGVCTSVMVCLIVSGQLSDNYLEHVRMYLREYSIWDAHSFGLVVVFVLVRCAYVAVGGAFTQRLVEEFNLCVVPALAAAWISQGYFVMYFVVYFAGVVISGILRLHLQDTKKRASHASL